MRHIILKLNSSRDSSNFVNEILNCYYHYHILFLI